MLEWVTFATSGQMTTGTPALDHLSPEMEGILLLLINISILQKKLGLRGK